ncbi:MAG TPA: alpha/beta fold hydrolase [Caulobacteraceae bacterium]|nr:alpha/beta fold hydrolase [Caulobacteraceae bacterium]
MSEHMITLRAVDDPDAVGPPRYISFDTADGMDRNLAQGEWVHEVLELFPPAPEVDGPALAPRRTGDLLFLVHGFNVDHAAAKAFHFQCKGGLADAGWRGEVVSYDWPSDGLVFAYLPDRSNARAAASGLVTSGIALLESTQRNDCAINVHVLAHSMGAFVMQQAITWAYQDVPPGWKIGQVITAAADVDHSVFSAGAPTANALAQHAGRLTAYCNAYDKALMVSNAKRLDLAPRMGRVGLPDDAPALMCEVDCSAYFAKQFPDLGAQLSPVTTHCFYFSQTEFWRDVVLTLAGGIDRSVIPTRLPDPTKPIANRYILNPAGIGDDAYGAALGAAGASPSIIPPD